LVTGIEPEKINEVTKNLSKTAHIPQRMNITANEEPYVEMEQNSKGS
jgi:TRAP-type C4-dicarboxylate transport system substrate-binding protein